MLILHGFGILEGRRIVAEGVIDSDVDKPWFIYTQNYFGKRMRLSPDRRWLVGGKPGTYGLTEIANLASQWESARSRPRPSLPPPPRTHASAGEPARARQGAGTQDAPPQRSQRKWEPLDLDGLMKETNRKGKEK